MLLDFQEMREEPRKIQKPIMERRVAGQVAQSESLKAFNWREESAGKNKP